MSHGIAAQIRNLHSACFKQGRGYADSADRSGSDDRFDYGPEIFCRTYSQDEQESQAIEEEMECALQENEKHDQGHFRYPGPAYPFFLQHFNYQDGKPG